MSCRNSRKVEVELSSRPWDRKNKFIEVPANIVIELTNFRLLGTSMDFCLICISGFFVFFCYFIPFVYVPKRAMELFDDKYTWIISIIGAYQQLSGAKQQRSLTIIF